jgi:hypothetical protein
MLEGNVIGRRCGLLAGDAPVKRAGETVRDVGEGNISPLRMWLNVALVSSVC